MSAPTNAAEKLERYIASQIEVKEQESTALQGELSALNSTLAALRQFRQQERDGKL